VTDALSANGYQGSSADPDVFNWITQTDTWDNASSDYDWVERYVLTKLYDDLDGPNWSRSDDWKSTTVWHCEWWKITCDSSGSVTKVSFSQNNGLSGTFPMDLIALTSMTELAISEENSLVPGATIPAAITQLSNLKFLAVQNVGITEIGNEIEQMSSLTRLNINRNQFGTFPTGLYGIGNQLTMLEMIGSMNSATIPTGINAFTKLLRWDLYGAKLVGEIPSEFGEITSLTYLRMGLNHFQNTIPTIIGQLSNLNQLYWTGGGNAYQKMIGPIPAEIINLTNLKSINLMNNALTGTIPPLPTSLTSCVLGSNNFIDTTNGGTLCGF